jgi:hypothetical protein
LIQNGASLLYVKEQMGHGSIQEEITAEQNATLAQPEETAKEETPIEVADLIGGGGWTRTNDLRIMRPSL